LEERKSKKVHGLTLGAIHGQLAKKGELGYFKKCKKKREQRKKKEKTWKTKKWCPMQETPDPAYHKRRKKDL